MRRALAWVLVLVCGLAVLPPSWAEQCKYCHNELAEGENPLKCKHCEEIAAKIRASNQKVWVLDFRRGEIGRVQIKDDTGDVETYWYLPYTITNRDEVAHEFFMDVSAVSDRGRKEFRYHDEWIPEAYETIRQHLALKEDDQLLTLRDLSMPPPGKRNRLPQLQDRRTNDHARIALPTIQPGETFRCVAMLGPLHPEADRLVVHVRGLTNTSLLAHDDYVAPDGRPNERVIKEAVLTLHYSRPGDEFAHGQDPIRFDARRWVDVKRTIKSDLR